MSQTTHKFKIGNISASKGIRDQAREKELEPNKVDPYMRHLIRAIAQYAVNATYVDSVNPRMLHHLRCEILHKETNSTTLCFYLYSLPTTEKRLIMSLLTRIKQIVPGIHEDQDVSFRIVDDHSLLIKICRTCIANQLTYSFCYFVAMMIIMYALHCRNLL